MSRRSAMLPPPEQMLRPYNPWWESREKVFEKLPSFRRPIFSRIYEDLRGLKQILSITGPRRVGKTTLIKQVIQKLLAEGASPERVIYFSLDDPLLFGSPRREPYVEDLLRWMVQRAHHEVCYVFLDEVQRLDRWELILKKYYDLEFPLRFVITGSASSPIFKKSRESLLGRVKEYHLLPFSFKEFVLYKKQDAPDFVQVVQKTAEFGQAMIADIHNITRASAHYGFALTIPREIVEGLETLLHEYIVEGGFPEVWEITDFARKQEYLFENQIQKVIFEDLAIATTFRKPENIKRFYLSLLEQPGQELNIEKVANRIGVSRPMLEKYFPLLEMTDLVKRLERFSRKVLKVRRGNVKCYLVDLALRNAILKLDRAILQDDRMMGVYAENLVFNVLRTWPGMVDLTYYREKQIEVDFVVNLGGSQYLPVEVKYRNEVTASDATPVIRFLEKYRQREPLGIIVTKRARRGASAEDDGHLFFVPLPIFLLVFG